MKKDFSKSWKSSKQPRKQRKYTANAPLHVRNKFISSHLSKELIKKHEIRNARTRIGDKVKVSRGQFKGKNGKVERISVRDRKVYLAGMDFTKKDGSKAFYPFSPSNLIITELDMSDRKRFKNKGGKGVEPAKAETKAKLSDKKPAAQPKPEEVKKEAKEKPKEDKQEAKK